MTAALTTTASPAKRHPNLKGSVPRLRLAGGPFVDAATLAQLISWGARGVSQGQIIDRLTEHAILTRYDPVTCAVTPPKANPVPPKRTRG